MNHGRKRISGFQLKLHGKDACPGPQFDSLGRDRGQDSEFSNDGKRDELSHSSDVIDA